MTMYKQKLQQWSCNCRKSILFEFLDLVPYFFPAHSHALTQKVYGITLERFPDENLSTFNIFLAVIINYSDDSFVQVWALIN